MNTPVILIALAVFLLMLAFVLRPFHNKKLDFDELIDGWVKEQMKKDTAGKVSSKGLNKSNSTLAEKKGDHAKEGERRK